MGKWVEEYISKEPQRSREDPTSSSQWFIKAEENTSKRRRLQIRVWQTEALIKVGGLSLKWLAYLAKWGLRMKPTGKTPIYPCSRGGRETGNLSGWSWEGQKLESNGFRRILASHADLQNASRSINTSRTKSPKQNPEATQAEALHTSESQSGKHHWIFCTSSSTCPLIIGSAQYKIQTAAEMCKKTQ